MHSLANVLSRDLVEVASCEAPPYDRTEPRDEIGFEVLNAYNIFVNNVRRAFHTQSPRVISTLKEKLAGVKPSRRAQAELSRKVFIKINRELKSIYMYQFKLPKGFTGRQRMLDVEYKLLTIFWRNSPRGVLYYMPTGLLLMFTDHFFDRLIERGDTSAVDAEEQRAVLVAKFLWKVFQRADNKFGINDATVRDFNVYMREGVGMGYVRQLSNRDGSASEPVALVKTFVGYDMLFPRQRENMKNARPVPSISYSITLPG